MSTIGQPERATQNRVIATTLRDMDTELAKTRNLKQGELLTGRIRLA